MSRAAATVPTRAARVTAVVGGALALVASGITAMMVAVRDVDFNALNLFTIVVGALGGLLALRASRQPVGEGLGLATLLVFLAAAPAFLGYVFLFYAVPLVLLIASIGLFVASNARSDNGP